MQFATAFPEREIVAELWRQLTWAQFKPLVPAVPELLRASHIKAWAACDTDAERLDVFNGLLLAPQIDAAFDRGLITIAADGEVLVSDALTHEARTKLCVDGRLCVRGLGAGHRGYLPWHRQEIFRGTK